MTTVHLTNAYHATSGGIRTFYSALLQAGNREGRRVVLVVPDERDGSERVGELAHVYRVRTPRAPAFDRRYRIMLPHHYAPLRGASIAAIIAREAPSVVEICDKYTLPYLANAPIGPTTSASLSPCKTITTWPWTATHYCHCSKRSTGSGTWPKTS